jgi:hypothetical protein
MSKTLRNVLPHEFFSEFLDTDAAKYLNEEVLYEIDGCCTAWTGNHKYVFNWWILENGVHIGWNENPSVGWSFPVSKPKGVLNYSIRNSMLSEVDRIEVKPTQDPLLEYARKSDLTYHKTKEIYTAKIIL